MHLSCALHSSAAAPPLQNDPSIYPSIYREPPQLGFSTNPEQYRKGTGYSSLVLVLSRCTDQSRCRCRPRWDEMDRGIMWVQTRKEYIYLYICVAIDGH